MFDPYPPCSRCGAASTITLIDDSPGGGGEPVLYLCSDDCGRALVMHIANGWQHEDKVKAKTRAKARAARKSRRVSR